VTSTMACAIAAQKLGIKVAHVEAGIRSGDWSMPEEINRMVTDAISNWFFTTSESANANLRRAGIEDERILFVGNTMIDTLLANLPRLREPECWKEICLVPKRYVVLTLHRPANVDEANNFYTLLQAVSASCAGIPVVFSVHPRTRVVVSKLPALPDNLHLLDPQPYLEFIYLIRHSLAVITDSGGITEEATVLDVPCLTLRANTERPETVDLGTNELIGTDPVAIGPAMARVSSGQWKHSTVPPFWDGHTAERIVDHLVRLLMY
jgi:UDP-N-acetylglucosamine 2-epimerase (non-hydrolysing)